MALSWFGSGQRSPQNTRAHDVRARTDSSGRYRRAVVTVAADLMAKVSWRAMEGLITIGSILCARASG
jgi:hypothetical protein